MDRAVDLPAILDRAARYLRDGDIERGITAYTEALAVRSDMGEAWFNLAWLQRITRRYDEALASYANAIAHTVARPEEAHVNRAVILSEHLFQPAEAEAELHWALALNPGFIQAWLNLGNLQEDLGRPDEAWLAYRQALAVEPGNGRAHARLAAIEVFNGRPAYAAERLEAALDGASAIESRTEMLFALGAALDACGAYDRAFQAFEAGNWLARSVARRRYDPAAQERLVDQIIRAFAEPLAPAMPLAGPAPVFICGMFRSGSTLAEQILGRHSAVTPMGELDFIPALVRSRLQPFPHAAATLSLAELTEVRSEYLSQLGPAFRTAMMTDKRCDNFQHIGLIKAMFPEAKIIHTVREPLDNLLSVYFLHFGEEVSYGNDLRDAAHFYIQYRRLLTHWRKLFGNDIHDFDYDHTVTAPRPQIEGLLRFLGLPWEDACLSPDLATGAVRTASVWQVRQPLHARSSGRRRNYEHHLAEVRQMLEGAGL